MHKKTCTTFPKSCATFWKTCTTFLKSCSTFPKICTTFPKTCTTFWKTCTTFLKSCSTFDKTGTSYIMFVLSPMGHGCPLVTQTVLHSLVNGKEVTCMSPTGHGSFQCLAAVFNCSHFEGFCPPFEPTQFTSWLTGTFARQRMIILKF